ncbi:MAG TPA: Ig-like domain-containing protein, partial [Opitutus sp.]|nr:Ig-like domain-containing protein [Opitutus sp.]
MKPRFQFFLTALLSVSLALCARAQQQPVVGVDIVQLSVLTGQGSVAYVELSSEGGGYTNAPDVTIEAPAGGGVRATARAVLTVGGTVSRIEIIDPGSGYTSNPEILISGGGGAGAVAFAQVGDVFGRDVVNDSFGSYRDTIAVTAEAVGTFVNSSFTYSFFVNGVSIGETTGPVPPGVRPTVLWRPPQPGFYFITVRATDGVSTVTSLAVRYFAEGTVVNSPLPGLVPQGSSVVVKADATVAGGFIQKIQFYDNGDLIGEDATIPYSIVYPVPGASGTVHNITARATDNESTAGSMSLPIKLTVVTPITPVATSVISTPANGAVIPIPSTLPITPIPIIVDATSRSGRISKVEAYVDGELFG